MNEPAPEKAPPAAGALRRIARLAEAELRALRGRPGPLVALGAPVLAAVAVALGYRHVGPSEDPLSLYNGWGCAARAASVALQVGAFALVLFASQIVARDAGSGALRTLLCGPHRRAEIFASKTLAALGWALAVFASVWAASLLMGLLLFGFGDVVEPIEYAGRTMLYVHKTAAEMRGVLLPVVLLTFPPLLASACLGLACSVAAVRPAPASVAAVALYLPLDVFLRRLFDDFAPYLFMTYTDRFPSVLDAFARGLSTAKLENGDVRLSLLASGGAAILLLAGSFNIFVFRDFRE